MENNLNTVDLYTLLTYEGGELLYEGAEGCIVSDRARGTVITDISDGECLCRLLHNFHLPNLYQFAVKSQNACSAVQKRFGFREAMPCSQWAYRSQTPPETVACDISPLTAEYVRVAAAHYGLVAHSEDYIADRVKADRMWGLFEDGRLAGFIGMHTEGSMGMLEIFPEYRRKGYGYALEAFLIAWHLSRGRVPYCHVIDGNDASIRLQKRLGMTRSEMPAIWVY